MPRAWLHPKGACRLTLQKHIADALSHKGLEPSHAKAVQTAVDSILHCAMLSCEHRKQKAVETPQSWLSTELAMEIRERQFAVIFKQR